MSRRADIDADALTAALLQAVKEARAAQTALEEAARPGLPGGTRPTAEAIRERLALLAELRDMGMEIVRGLSVQLRAAEQAAGTDVAFSAVIEAADVFARLSRAIRLVMMLEMRAEDALRALLAGRPAARVAAAAGPPPPEERASEPTPAAELAAELREDAAPETEPAAEAERLIERDARALDLDDIRAAARERLFLDRSYADFLTRPLEQLIPDLCRDLGLTALRQARCASHDDEIRPSWSPPPPVLAGASHMAPPTHPFDSG